MTLTSYWMYWKNALQREDFSDFEDCLQDECAKQIHADYIVTRNTSDFSTSDIPAIIPDDLQAYQGSFRYGKEHDEQISGIGYHAETPKTKSGIRQIPISRKGFITKQ